MNNNIKELIEQYINEEHIKLMNIINYVTTKEAKNFKNQLSGRIKIFYNIRGYK